MPCPSAQASHPILCRARPRAESCPPCPIQTASRTSLPLHSCMLQRGRLFLLLPLPLLPHPLTLPPAHSFRAVFPVVLPRSLPLLPMWRTPSTTPRSWFQPSCFCCCWTPAARCDQS